MTVNVVEQDTGGATSFRFRASCSGVFCGEIDGHRVSRRIGGRVVWAVDHVYVTDQHRRRGVATKLYEAAAQAVCARRGRLASTNRSAGAYSNDFWQKQVAKGRARAVRRRHGMAPAYVLTDCPVTTLARARRRR